MTQFKGRFHQIYIIFVPTGVYIGRSKELINRMRSHGMLYCDWAVLETITDGRNPRDVEYDWVKHFVDLGVNVLNKDKECNRPGILGHSKESRDKTSAALTGIKRPIEFRQKRSAAMMGNKHAAGNTNRLGIKPPPLSDEGRYRLSKATGDRLRGRSWSIARREAQNRRQKKVLYG